MSWMCFWHCSSLLMFQCIFLPHHCNATPQHTRCPVSLCLSTSYITEYASAFTPKPLHPWVMTARCHDRLLIHASFSCLNPGTAINYPICAELTGSETQLCEVNKRGDLEKECLHSKGPRGFKGHYIGERLAELKALAISLPSGCVCHERLL